MHTIGDQASTVISHKMGLISADALDVAYHANNTVQ